MKGPELNSNSVAQESSPRRFLSGLSTIKDQVLLDENSRNSLRVDKSLSRVSGALVVNEASLESRTKRPEG